MQSWLPLDITTSHPVSFKLTGVGRPLIELLADICIGCASEEHDEYLDRADCVCHERGYN